MNLLRRGTDPRPYAANSTGQPLGTLRLRTQVRRVQLYQAEGEARAIFVDKLKNALRDHLHDNFDKLQYSGSLVVFSLYMVGKSPDRTWPIVMLVSDDKQVRTGAFRMIRDSGIMKDFPGFDLGHMDLRAEFEDLRPLGSQASRTAVGPDPKSFFAPSSTVDVFTSEPGASGARRLAVYAQDGTTSFAVAEGVFGYRGRHFLHSANHSLLPAQKAQSDRSLPLPTASDTGEDEDECEIMGLSDDEEEEDDLVDITSRESASPVENGSEGTFDSLSGSQTLEESLFSYGNTTGQDTHITELSRLETQKTLTEDKTPHGNTPWTKVGHVALGSALLDSAFVQIDTSLGRDMAKLRYEALALESYHHYIETAPSDTAIKTSTPNGTIGGTLSGTPSFVRLPGSNIFQEVYIAMLNRPLVPGDCGSWVKNAITGKLFGHVIAGSPKTGLVLLIPASRLFAGALDALSAWDSAEGADVGKLIGFKADVEAVSTEDVAPRAQPSFLASGVDIRSDYSALNIWRSTTAAMPRSGEGIHNIPSYNEGEPSGQSKFDKHEKMRLSQATLDRWQPTLDRLAKDLAVLNNINNDYTRREWALDTHIQHIIKEWACPPTSREEHEKLLEGSRKLPLPRLNDSFFGGDFIPDRLLASERIRPVGFITDSAAFAHLPILISPEYQASYVFTETLAALGHPFVPLKIHPSLNPKGGRLFTPIGICTLFMSVRSDPDDAGPGFITALVLNEPAADFGVCAILGKPDIERIAGPYPFDLDDAASGQIDHFTRPKPPTPTEGALPQRGEASSIARTEDDTKPGKISHGSADLA